MDTAAESTPDRPMAATVDSRPHEHGPVLGRGALIGRYLVLGDLGAGAMGVVYAAYDPKLDRKIALKLLNSGLGSPDARARLLREAQSMARLAHPNVVTVHDVGTFGDEVFVAMEFVQGVTVTRWLAAKARGWREVVEVFISAGRGLRAAHDAGLVHRDFKPDNIMVGDDGRVRVMDFGLARTDAIDIEAVGNVSLTGGPALEHLTRPGSLLGTPAYMAPEQWEGTGVDHRADQFAYCVALWEGLYGERPFHGNSLASLMTAVTSGQRTEPSEPKRVARWLRPVLDRGLATKADARWPSMDSLLRELARDRLARTRRWLAIGTGAAVIIAGGLGIQQVLEKRAAAVAERERADTAELVSIEQLWKSLLIQARASSRTQEPGRRFATLQAVRDAVGVATQRGRLAEEFLTLRNAAIAGLALADIRLSEEISADYYGGNWVSMDPMLRRVATSDRAGNITLRSLEEGKSVQIPSPVPDAWYVHLWLGERGLAVNYAARTNSLNVLFDISGRSPVERLRGDDYIYYDVTDDHGSVWRRRPDGELQKFDIASGEVVKTLSTRSDSGTPLMDPSGRYLAVLDGSTRRGQIIDLHKDAVISTIDAISGLPAAAAWGRPPTLVTGDGPNIVVWDAFAGEQLVTLKGHESDVIFLHVNANNRHIAAWDGDIQVWDWPRARSVLSMSSGGGLVRFRADGAELATRSFESIRVWEFDEGAESRTLAGPVNAVDFSADGQIMAVSGPRGAALIRTESFDLVARVRPGPCDFASFGPTGAVLLTFCEGGLELWPLNISEAPGPVVGMPQHLLPESPGVYRVAVWPPGSPWFAASAEHGTVRLFDTQSGAEGPLLRGPQAIRTLALSRDGQWAVSGGWRSGKIIAWHTSEPDKPRILAGSPEGLSHFVFTMDGRGLLLDANNQRTLLDVGTWQAGLTTESHHLDHSTVVAASSDGRTLAAVQYPGEVHLLSAIDLRQIAVLPIPSRTAIALTFSPDGRYLACAAGERGLHLWDLALLRRRLSELGLDWAP